MLALLFCSLFLVSASGVRHTPNATAAVVQHVLDTINMTFRQPSGVLAYPYLVPSGPYQEAWLLARGPTWLAHS